MAFRVGQKVVCIDAERTMWSRPWIKKGGIYVIARIFYEDHRQFDMMSHLRCTTSIDLVGIPKPNGFSALRFRAVVERKTDISIFQRTLVSHGVDA